MERWTRRRTLRAAASLATLSALTGCQSDGDGGTPASTPSTDAPTVDVSALEATTTAFVERLAAGEYQTAIDEFDYTDAVGQQLDADSLAQVWTTQTASLGQFVEVASVEYATSQGYHVTVAQARFTDGVQLVRVVYDDQSRIAGLQFPGSGGAYSPPDYAEESTFTETERTLSATDGCELPAKLALPTTESAGSDPVPGVVLVHGSGPNDMDETIGPNKVFRDVAWGLASRGVAVLRYDKRTYACDVDVADVTLDEKVTDDALTALSVLREPDRVDPDRTAVVGHSLGGMVAPRIASRDGELAGVAMLAANARPLPDLVVEQVEYLVNLDGTVTDAERAQIQSVREAVERIRSLDIDDGEVVLDLGGRPFWAALAEYDQVATAESLDIPLAVHQGARDYQVSSERDFEAWRDALGDREAVTFDSYDDLNHLFMAGEGQSNPNEYFQADNVDRRVVENLAAWIAGLA